MTDKPIGPNEYKCANCGGVFEKSWSDEEAAEELTNTFPGFEQQDCDVVCDDCYKLIMGTTPPDSLTGSAQGGNA